MPQSTPLYLLTVGIDQWLSPLVPELEGCENDVRMMKQVFRQRLAVPEENIKMLLGAEATRAGLETAFRQHLIDRAKSWKDSGAEGPAPAFVFHYSGHGSRAIDASGTQPDGMDETLVPQDSRIGDVYDLKDWEFAQWLEELSQYSDNVTIILDCCHSGGATRDTESTGTKRDCPMDERPQPVPRPAESTNASLSSPIGNGTRSTNENDSSSKLPYLLLAACRSDQYAQEYPITQSPDGANDEMGELIPNAKATKKKPNLIKLGAFSWFLVNEVMSLPQNQVISYRDLFERVRYAVSTKYKSQTPQIRGHQDRQLFGGAKIVRDPFASVVKINKHTYTVNAGALNGLTKSSELVVYPKETKTLADAGDPIATFKIQYMEATLCRCRRVGPDASSLDKEEFDEKVLHSKVLLPPPFSGGTRKLVSIEIEDAAFAESLRQQLTDSDAEPYINASCADPSDEPATGDFRITRHSERLFLRDASGTLLAKPESDSEIELLGKNLKKICTYQNALGLRNNSPGSFLRNKLSIKFHSIDDSEEEEEFTTAQRAVRKVKDIPTTADGTPLIEMGKSFAIEVSNHSDRTLYCRATSFGHDFALSPLEAATDEKPVIKGNSKWYGLEISELVSELYYPEPEEGDQVPAEAKEYLKIVASEDENMLPSFEQTGIKLPGDEDEEPFPSGTRGGLATRNRKRDKNDWTTVECEYLVVPPRDSNQTRAIGGQKQDIPQYDLTVEPPAGANWDVAVMTQSQSTRATPTTAVVRPTGLIWQSDLSQSIGVTPKTVTGPSGDAIAITADASAFGQLTDETPFRLSLPESNGLSSVAVAWDGACCYPVGFSATDNVPVTWMPACDGAIQTPDQDDPQSFQENSQSRGLLRTTKLYLYNLVGIKAADLGLHQSRFVRPENLQNDPLLPHERIVPVMGGEARMRKLDHTIETKGKRIALIVHGFSSDGFNTLAQLSTLIGDRLDEYDTVLTFDYESFRTPLSESARLLSESMLAAGFGQDDGAQLDVFANGMGAILTRSLVEQHSGTDFVDRCFLAGPPNQGTQLLSYAKAIPWIGTAMVNAAGPNPVSLFLSAAIKKVTKDAVALMDLKPDSELLRGLNAGGSKPSIPYYIIAGRFNANDQTEPRWYQAASALADFGMDQFFGDQHDLLVNTASMTGIEGTDVTIEQVNSSHFDYFQNPEVGKLLKTWLS